MDFVFRNGLVYRDGKFVSEDIRVSNGVCVPMDEYSGADTRVFNCTGLVLLPGFVDVHVHLREPGFSYKETVETGTKASARGGYTTVCSMPNLSPTPDTAEHLQPQLDAIAADACIRVIPYGAITVDRKGEKLADFDAIASNVVAFSDDGSGVQETGLMEKAMLEAKRVGKCIVAHCEDNALLHGGYIHDGEYARTHGHLGICSESEWGPIARDLELVRKTGCSYHVCHISAKESVELIRRAKAEGLDVTCETGPHYLVLDDSKLEEDGRFKMNPPLRSAEDREALIRGICDGTIDMIATDHAPHSAEEKSRGLKGSAMGIVGIETAFAMVYTHLVKPGIITLERLMELLHDAPNRRFGFDGGLEVGKRADFTIFDLDHSYIIDPDEFLSKGKSMPFIGWEVQGRCRMTVAGGKIAWTDGEMEEIG